jgi:hypothetical protein
VAEGTVASSGTISLDASSVTTLQGLNYIVNISNKEMRHSLLTGDRNEARYFRIDGSSVKGVAPAGNGVYIKAERLNGMDKVTPLVATK